jgi:hemerythrin superfamily protein
MAHAPAYSRPNGFSNMKNPGMIAGIAAVGFLAGVGAAVGRKMAVQGMEAMAGDWVDVLKAEHRAVEKLFAALEATPAKQAGKRAMLFGKIKLALSKHAFQEEQVVYPAIAKSAASNGAARHLAEDHFEIKQLLAEGSQLQKSQPVFMDTVKALRALVEKHVREEEEEIFPALRALQSDEECATLTKRMHKEGVKLA